MKYLWFMFLDAMRFENSMWSGRMRGHFRVIYPDGKFSQIMFHKTARDYAWMFGGKVVFHKQNLVK